MWSLSDEALVAGLAAGDQGAATAFVRRFQARVFGLAVTMVGDRAVAEEIAQEAFTRAWRHAGAYDARPGRDRQRGARDVGDRGTLAGGR